MAIKIYVLLLIVVSTYRKTHAQPINANAICSAEEVSEITSEHLKSLDEEVNNANLLIQHLTESTNVIKYSEESLKLQEDLDKTKGTVKMLNTKACTFETQLLFYFKLSKLDSQESKCATNTDKVRRSLKNKVHFVLQKAVFDKFKVTFALQRCRIQMFYGGSCSLFINCCQQSLTQLTNKIASAVNKIESSIAQAELDYNNCLKKAARAALQIETDITKELLKCRLEETEDQSSESDEQSESSTDKPNLDYTSTSVPVEPSDVPSNTEKEIPTELPSQNNSQENKPSTEVVLQLQEQGNTQDNEAETVFSTEFPERNNIEPEISTQLPQQSDNQENYMEEISSEFPKQSDKQENGLSTEVISQLPEQNEEQKNEFPEQIDQESTKFPEESDNQDNKTNTKVSTKLPEQDDNQENNTGVEVITEFPEEGDNRENESNPEQNNNPEPEIVTEIPDQSYFKNETKTEASSETPGLANDQENELEKDTSISFLETGHIEEIRTDAEDTQSSHEKANNQDYRNKDESTEQDSNVENEYGYEIQQEDNSPVKTRSASDSEESSEEFGV